MAHVGKEDVESRDRTCPLKLVPLRSGEVCRYVGMIVRAEMSVVTYRVLLNADDFLNAVVGSFRSLRSFRRLLIVALFLR